MNNGFTKLFSSIISSSIWSEDDKTRLVWITFLALADADGFVSGAIPGIAALARMSVEDAERSIIKLLSPDKYSRSQAEQGRRLKSAEGGWLIINYPMYRSRERLEERKEYLRNYQREYMRKVRKVSNTSSTNVQPSASVSVSGKKEGDCKGEDDFAVFWEAYPKHKAKPVAFKAWCKAKLPELSIILAAIEKQKQTPDWRKDNGQFIPYPASWLNGRQWEDETIPLKPIRAGFVPDSGKTEVFETPEWYAAHPGCK